MKGRAPNSPETGSQMSLIQKLKPNFSIESIDWRQSSQPIPATIRTTSAAKAPVPHLNPRSPLLSQRRMRAVLRGLDRAERGQFELHDLGRKGRVAQLGRELLPVGERPLH